MPEKNELLETMTEEFQAAVTSGAEEAYLKLSATLEKMNKELRNYVQKLTLPEMKVVLEKLKNEESLSDTDIKHLKSWIVGDAQRHIDTVKSFDDWSAELQKAVKVLSDLWSSKPDPERLVTLRTLTRDTAKTVSNIAFFVRQKESVEKFNTAIQTIGEPERMILMSLLEQKISTSNF